VARCFVFSSPSYQTWDAAASELEQLTPLARRASMCIQPRLSQTTDLNLQAVVHWGHWSPGTEATLLTWALTLELVTATIPVGLESLARIVQLHSSDHTHSHLDWLVCIQHAQRFLGNQDDKRGDWVRHTVALGYLISVPRTVSADLDMVLEISLAGCSLD